MQARLLLLLTILALTVGCAPGYYETPPASQAETSPKMFTNPYTNPETQQEYEQRIWWENFETEWPRFFRR